MRRTPAKKVSDRVERAARRAAWRKVHQEEIAVYNAAYRKTHKVEAAAWRKAHRAERAKYDAAYCKLHRADIAERKAAYYKAHKTERLERATYCAAWRKVHKAEIAAYRKANLDKRCDHEARRRALKRGAPAERIYRAVVFERDAGRCHLCGKKVRGKWHLDHIVPLSQGGEHSYRNVAVAHPACNLRKHTKRIGQLRLC